MRVHQIKKLLHSKETINKMRRQSMECEKIFVNHKSDKGLISKRHRKLIQLNRKKKKSQRILINKWTEQTVSEADTQRPNRVHEKVLTITNHEGNASQNHSDMEKREAPYALLMGM